MSKNPTTQRQNKKTNPGAILTFFTLMDHDHGHIILWHVDTKPFVGVHAKHGVYVALYNLKVSLIIK
jgi:hypothetical protein